MSVPELNKQLMPNTVLEAAAAFAGRKILGATRTVLEVEVFGSIARGEATENSDIDLILIVDEPTARRFYDYVRFDHELSTNYRASKWIRCRAANELLGCLDPTDTVEEYFDLLPECEWLYELLDDTLLPRELIGYMFDVFLLPINWKSRLDEFQELGQHSDQEFMRNIARDARFIALR